MTNTTTDAAEARALPVIQADRDAAEAVYADLFSQIRNQGHQVNRKDQVTPDSDGLVQAFASHRLATAEAASGAGERADTPWGYGWYDDGGGKHTLPHLPTVDTLRGVSSDAFPLYRREPASLPLATDPAMVTVPGDREQLRAMSDRATPGPWAWEQCGEKEDAPVVGIAFPGDDPDCKSPYEGEFRDGDACRMTIAYDWQWCDGHSPAANASFAVACVNYVRSILAAAPTIPATGEAVPKPLRVDWNKHDLAEAYDLVEGVRSKMAQSPESPLDTSLRAALDAIEAADCEWDGLTKATIPATGHAATEGEGASHADRT